MLLHRREFMERSISPIHSVENTLATESKESLRKFYGVSRFVQQEILYCITPANAKHSATRQMVSTMSAMWKTDSKFDEKLL